MAAPRNGGDQGMHPFSTIGLPSFRNPSASGYPAVSNSTLRVERDSSYVTSEVLTLLGGEMTAG